MQTDVSVSKIQNYHESASFKCFHFICLLILMTWFCFCIPWMCRRLTRSKSCKSSQKTFIFFFNLTINPFILLNNFLIIHWQRLTRGYLLPFCIVFTFRWHSTSDFLQWKKYRFLSHCSPFFVTQFFQLFPIPCLDHWRVVIPWRVIKSFVWRNLFKNLMARRFIFITSSSSLFSFCCNCIASIIPLSSLQRVPTALLSMSGFTCSVSP